MVKRFLGGGVKWSAEEWVRRAKKAPNLLAQWGAITDKLTGRFMGRWGLDTAMTVELDPGLFISVILATEFQGMGLGREVANALIDEAFTKRGAGTVWVEVHEKNEISLKLWASLGFTKRAGITVVKKDRVQMALEKSDWQSGVAGEKSAKLDPIGPARGHKH